MSAEQESLAHQNLELKRALVQAEDTLIDCAQLFDGWRQGVPKDEWTAWDAQARQKITNSLWEISVIRADMKIQSSHKPFVDDKR